MTKLVMTLLVRNEADLIEAQLRFHAARGVDAFVVMDNLSDDATPDILRALAAELDLTLLHQSEDTYDQRAWVTRMARMAHADLGADWVINSDADEFWCPTGGDLKAALAGIDADVTEVMVPRHNALLIHDGPDPLTAFAHPAQTVLFETESLNSQGQPLPRKALHRGSSAVSVSQGNHRAEGLGGRTLWRQEAVRILHYPYRTLEGYRRKVALGGAAYGRNTTLPDTAGATWKSHAAGIGSGVVEEFWRGMALSRGDADIAAFRGLAFEDRTVRDALTPGLRGVLADVTARTAVQVDEVVRTHAEMINAAGADRINRPMYYNLRFGMNGALRHLEGLRTLDPDPLRLARSFAGLRDLYSLFPRNAAFADLLRGILQAICPEDAARLAADCKARRIILHTTCHPRIDRARDALVSFAALGDGYHHILLLGEPGATAESSLPLRFSYRDGVLHVPAPDSYEALHRKLFYAFTLLSLLTSPRLLVKLDDDVLLSDAAVFGSVLDRVEDRRAAYAGKRVGSRHHERQWHGWHLGKCVDPQIEMRGYQYPLPSDYAAGGHGYILGPAGLEACAYMYLAMKEFFAMPVVGLEDACVGHAMFARGIDLMDLANMRNWLTLEGLTTRARRALDSSREG